MPALSTVRRRTRRAAAMAGAAALGLSLLAAPSAAQAADATWDITSVRNPPGCLPTSGYGSVYVLFTVSGSWSSEITYGLTDLPGDTWMQGSSISADADDATGSVNGLAIWRDDSYVAPGTYTLRLTATDGTVTQTAPVTVTVGDDC